MPSALMFPIVVLCKSGHLQALCDVHDNVSETVTRLHMSKKGHDSGEELELSPGRIVGYGGSGFLHRP